MVAFQNEWDELLKDEFQKPYYRRIHNILKQEYSRYTIYPDMYDIFNALKLTSYSDVKAVILGQDPYHGPGQAHGLCFSDVYKRQTLRSAKITKSSPSRCRWIPRAGSTTWRANFPA